MIHLKSPTSFSSIGRRGLVALAVLLHGFSTRADDKVNEVRFITTEASGECHIAEVVVNGVLVGHAFRPTDSEEVAPVTGVAHYFPPNMLIVNQEGDPTPVLTVLVTDDDGKSARSTSAQYRAQRGKALPYGLALVATLDPRTCESTISAATPARFAEASFFEQLFSSSKAEPAGGFSARVMVSIVVPAATEFTDGRHAFTRRGTEWLETREGVTIAQYDETDRNLAGFDLLDRVGVTQSTPFGTRQVPRIVHVPSGFKFWQSGRGRDAITEYRPTDAMLLKAPRVDTGLRQSVIVSSKSFIRPIVVDDVKDGSPIPDTTAKRLGFGDMVGGRSDALAFALATDRSFSELPTSPRLDPATARLGSALRISAVCAGDFIGQYSVGALDTAFGKEGPLASEGKIVSQPTVRETKSGQQLQRLDIGYEISGRPNALSLPAFIAIKPRSCSWIWHRIELRASCSSGEFLVTASSTGSGFPSRRTWVNYDLVQDLDQGAFDRLWECDPDNPERVR